MPPGGAANGAEAREFGAREEVIEPDPGSNPTDDGGRGVLEDHPDDPVQEALQRPVQLGLTVADLEPARTSRWFGERWFGERGRETR